MSKVNQKIVLTMSDGSKIESNPFVFESGVKIVTITDVASTATEGTLTAEQLEILTTDPTAQLVFNNEVYYPMDRQHEAGYLTYVHSGYNFSAGQFPKQAIVVACQTGGWQLVKEESSVEYEKQKYYSHKIFIRAGKFGDSSYSGKVLLASFEVIIPRVDPFEDVDALGKYLGTAGYRGTFFPATGIYLSNNYASTSNGYYIIAAQVWQNKNVLHFMYWPFSSTRRWGLTEDLDVSSTLWGQTYSVDDMVTPI